MKHFTLMRAIAYVTLFSGSLGASTIISTFDTDLDGWTSNPQGTIAFNAAGYLQETDAASNGNMHVSAPGKFLGNLTGAGSLSVDIRVDAIPTTIQASFGTLTFVNSAAGSSISLDLGAPATVWTSYATVLNPAAFGVDSGTYSLVMSNVTGLTLILEADKDSGVETVSMDNFQISAAVGTGDSVPEPGSFILFGSALVLFGLALRLEKTAL
jgi:hypothetical protein